LKLLLDTHAMAWAMTDPDRLSPHAKDAISSESNNVLVSVISPWEIAIKRSKDRLRVPDDFKAAIEAHRFELLSVQLHHTDAFASLPRHHGDPFDRMLVAQAIVEDLTLVTSDRAMRRYPVATLPAS
jgi:PIN domain nuclease of toxin-antitoxin system